MRAPRAADALHTVAVQLARASLHASGCPVRSSACPDSKQIQQHCVLSFYQCLSLGPGTGPMGQCSYLPAVDIPANTVKPGFDPEFGAQSMHPLRL